MVGDVFTEGVLKWVFGVLIHGLDFRFFFNHVCHVHANPIGRLEVVVTAVASVFGPGRGKESENTGLSNYEVL